MNSLVKLLLFLLALPFLLVIFFILLVPLLIVLLIWALCFPQKVRLYRFPGSTRKEETAAAGPGDDGVLDVECTVVDTEEGNTDRPSGNPPELKP